MHAILLSSLAAVGISLVGSLPLGNLNITAMYVAANKGIRAAMYFALGVVFVEVLYLRVSLLFISWIIMHGSLFHALQWFVVVLFILMAINSFFALRTNREHTPVIQKSNPLFLGCMLSALNPLQIPFWAGWALYLTNAKLLDEGNTSHHIFALSAGAGTFLALYIFIFFGVKLSTYIKANTVQINLLMGILFLLLAGYQAWSLFTTA